MKRIFSGIQPSGNLHIGNYLGAVQHWIKRQDEGENLFCIVDMHAITVPREPEILNHNIYELAGLLFACGLDLNKSTLFIQSHVHEHAELAWILNCHVNMGVMKRMTQFKEKSGKRQDNVSVGLFTYPVLMAADILLYQSNLVPVGDDQKQHVELCRDIAESFNAKYGETFTVPQPLIAKQGARIMSLDDPMKKMAKSETNKNRAVYLLDDADTIRQKIMRATTDSNTEIVFDPTRPGIFNLLTIYQMFSEKTTQDIESKFNGKQYSVFKKELADLIIDKLLPIQNKYNQLIEDKDNIKSMLKAGAQKVQPISQKTLTSVKEKVGML